MSTKAKLRHLWKLRRQRTLSFFASSTLHALVIAIVVVLAYQVKEAAEEENVITIFQLPPPPPPPPPPPAGGGRKKPDTPKPIEIPKIPENVLIPPKEIPKEVPQVDESLPDVPDEGVDGGMEGGVPGGVPGGVVGGVVGGVIGGTLGGTLGGQLGGELGAEPRRITADVTPPVLLTRVEPDYPPIAKRAEVQGEVILECIIGEDGTVKMHRVVKSIPMLEKAAVEAVERWKYKPAIYQGRPQAVYLIVRVTFKLEG